MILYVNGCSWSSLSTEDMTGKVYGEFLSEKLNCQLINHAIPGASNNRIFRSTVRNLEKLKNIDDVVCVINVTQLYREEIWISDQIKQTTTDQFHDKQQYNMKRMAEIYRDSNDGDYISYLPSQSAHFDDIPNFKEYKKYKLMFSHFEQAFYDFYYELVMLVTYLNHNKIKYLIFFGAPLTGKAEEDSIDSNLEWISIFKDQINKNPAVLNENFCEWGYNNGYKNYEGDVRNQWPIWIGHPDEQAHKAWADYLHIKLKELYNI